MREPGAPTFVSAAGLNGDRPFTGFQGRRACEGSCRQECRRSGAADKMRPEGRQACRNVAACRYRCPLRPAKADKNVRAPFKCAALTGDGGLLLAVVSPAAGC